MPSGFYKTIFLYKQEQVPRLAGLDFLAGGESDRDTCTLALARAPSKLTPDLLRLGGTGEALARTSCLMALKWASNLLF